MNTMAPPPSRNAPMAPTAAPAVAPDGLERLNGLWSALDEIRGSLASLAGIGHADIDRRVARITRKIESFEPNVTLIGQVKAGKTALVNALVGQPGLLPSDVNPWTSVITCLHVNSRRRPDDARAIFRFFDEDEWDRLVMTGGKLGELAQRAGFADEREDVRRQVLEMREKSRARLGRRFELLLGTAHVYEQIDAELINRYVCYGEWDDDPAEGMGEGRFADITKTADIYLDLPGYPTGLCLRDTPGVNDTFMMREQITINSIRDSRLCVVVLSAGQALSTMDMALLRLISNVQAREVVIFVNRIDELADPAAETGEIERSLRETLARHDVARDVAILFGSALWATHALSGGAEPLPAASARGLARYAAAPANAATVAALGDGAGTAARAWRLAGLPALPRCIAERIAEGPGRAMLAEARDETGNLLAAIEAEDADALLQLHGDTARRIDRAALSERLDALEVNLRAALDKCNAEAAAGLDSRMDRARQRFVGRVLDALASHIRTYGEHDRWHYNPSGLRMMLRTAYLSFGGAVRKNAEATYSVACTELEKVYSDMFGIAPGKVKLKPPPAPRLLPPATVGQTIALDLQASWWRKWWRSRRAEDNARRQYAALIGEETGRIVADLSQNLAAEYCRQTVAVLDEFMAGQRDSLLALSDRSNDRAAGRVAAEDLRRLDRIRQTRRVLDRAVA